MTYMWTEGSSELFVVVLISCFIIHNKKNVVRSGYFPCGHTLSTFLKGVFFEGMFALKYL